MRARHFVLFAITFGALLFSSTAVRAQNTKKDYLSDLEGDKIRDAESSSERIGLFLTFAADRLQKLQYELNRTEPERNRAATLNGLLNGYAGCIDDAADLVVVETEKQTDIRGAVKEFQNRGKEFLATLEKLATDGPELDTYKETLLDAIEGTKDALNDVQQAAKKLAPPPRKKP